MQKDLLEKVKPYEIRILAYKAENKLLDAIKDRAGSARAAW
jgi:hypothetical protein